MSKTKAMRDWQNRVAELGCIACSMNGYSGTPAELHHIRETAGIGQKSGDEEVIPLCPAHHRGTLHPRVPSIHLDRGVFIEWFGTELNLLAEIRRRLA